MLEIIHPILQREFLGNALQDYLRSVLVFLGGLLALYILKGIFIRRIKSFAEKTATKIDDWILGVFQRLALPLLYFGAFYFAVKILVLSPPVDKVLISLWMAVLTIQGVRLAAALATYLIQECLLKKEKYIRMGVPKSKTMLTIIKVVVWGLGLAFLLDNLGFNISAVIAGLGIGGVAVALAAQTILGDLFNYFVIFFDRPFEEGDFIIIGEYLGTIEHIGIKTTRVRSLGGEQLVFSNSDLTSNRVRNYKRMDKRRVLFKVGVTYSTTYEKLKKAIEIIKGVIEGLEDTVFDRAHFQSFGDFCLNIEIVYYVMGADYNKYMDIQQKINLGIKQEFEKEGIEFAYPTQTLYLSPQSIVHSPQRG